MKTHDVSIAVEPGQLRVWEDVYFQHTAPSEGFEYFMVLWKCEGDKWMVRFRGGKMMEMRESVVMKTTQILDAHSSLSTPLSKQLSLGSSTSSSQR